MKGYAFFVISALIVLSFTSCKKVVVSCLGVSSSVIAVGEPLLFSNCSTNGESYVWSFGDGATSTDESPTHTYTRVGTYEVTLSAVSKKDKKSDEQTLTIQVLPNANNSTYSGNETFRMTYRIISRERYYNNLTMTYRDTVYRDTTVQDLYLAFSEGGTAVYLDLETIFSNCNDFQAALSGDEFSAPSQTNFVCKGSTWNGLGFGGLTGTFSNHGASLTYSYSFSQLIDSNDTGVLSLEVSGTGLRNF